MSDSDVREIQLSGKQLFFLFMVSVVLAVAVFLLGVSVGLRVRANLGPGDPASETVRAAGGSASVAMPPPTIPEPRDLSYHDQLQGRAGAAAPPPPSPASPAPTIVAPSGDAVPVDEPQPSGAAAAVKTPSTQGAASANTPAAGARAPATAPFWVQAGAFKFRTNAGGLETKLKAAGLPVRVEPARGLFQVRVGPYAERADADRALTRVRPHAPEAKVTR